MLFYYMNYLPITSDNTTSSAAKNNNATICCQTKMLSYNRISTMLISLFMKYYTNLNF